MRVLEAVLDEYNLHYITLSHLRYKNRHGWKTIHERISNQAAPEIDEKILHASVTGMVNVTMTFKQAKDRLNQAPMPSIAIISLSLIWWVGGFCGRF